MYQCMDDNNVRTPSHVKVPMHLIMSIQMHSSSSYSLMSKCTHDNNVTTWSHVNCGYLLSHGARPCLAPNSPPRHRDSDIRTYVYLHTCISSPVPLTPLLHPGYPGRARLVPNSHVPNIQPAILGELGSSQDRQRCIFQNRDKDYTYIHVTYACFYVCCLELPAPMYGRLYAYHCLLLCL